jgi:hypothetical protein
MKKALLLAGLLLVVLVLLMLPPSSTPLSAQSGCCKIRDDPNNGQWKKALDLTFEQCRQRKKDVDHGGDLFAGTGRVWWDRDCS